MSFICNFCSVEFSQKTNLHKHLNDKRCKSILLINTIQLNEHIDNLNKLIEGFKTQIKVNGDNNITNTLINSSVTNNNDIKIEINVNPITNLNVKYMDTDKMMKMIEIYDKTSKNQENINILLSNYISEIICNEEHPENHTVKYTNKRPPTFMTITKDDQGYPVCNIKGLKDTCELVSDPILDELKLKMKQFIKKHKTDENYNYDFFEESINELRNELKKDNIKKALSSVLQNDIMNNIQMKITYKCKNLQNNNL